jgi:hypothetical protein
MKHIKYILLLVSVSLITIGCSEDDTELLIVDINSEQISFTNTFATEYLLSEATQNNIADRLIWTEVTHVTINQYTVEASTSVGFENPMLIGITNKNNHVVLVSDLLNLANELNLDSNPDTTGANGQPNNTGVVYFRVQASIGNDGADTESIFSEVIFINIKILEEAINDEPCDPLYVLGDATVDIGWNFPGKEVSCSNNVLSVKLNLGDGFLNFFTTVGDWGSVRDYTYFEDQGYTIDSAFENSPAGDSFKFIGIPGIYTLIINQDNKTISLQESISFWAVGDAVPGGWNFNDSTVELVEVSPDVWSASISLSNNIFRFFQNFGEWNLNNNFTYYVNEGFTIDPAFEQGPSGDANFNFIGTPGSYQLTINAVDKIITLN